MREMFGHGDVAMLENRCADAWPALVDVPFGDWRMRAAGGFTGRANSTLTVGDPGAPVAEALRRTTFFASEHGIPPCAHVVVGSPVESEISEAGWVVDTEHPGGAETAVLTGPLRATAPEGGTSVHEAPPTGWWQLAVGTAHPSPAQRHVLETGDRVGFGTVTRNGRVVGGVRGAVVGDLLHVARLAVLPDYRRRGFATALLNTLYGWARDHGARRQALQVATHNETALRLYQGLGCVEHHRYRYWVPR